MGRWVVIIIVISGILMAGGLAWLRSHQESFQQVALQGLVNDFQSVQSQFQSSLPDDLQFRAGDNSWSFRFQGDELWVQAPALEAKATSLSPELFDKARLPLLESFRTWLIQRPGDTKKFPIRLQFRNEPAN